MIRHIPVLLHEVLESLQLKPGMTVIDGTLGDAGHAEAMLGVIGESGKLLGIDADAEALLRAKQFLYAYTNQVTLVRDNFSELQKVLEETQFGHVDAILFDFGWSTPQFEERKRGFSFTKTDEPLDMRYNTRLVCDPVESEPPLSLDGKQLYSRCTAAEIVNTATEAELAELFATYGEEPQAKGIAAAIVAKRNEVALETVGDLVSCVLEFYRKKLKTEKEVPWVGGLHPATKVFQALRMRVNDELGVIESVLPQAIDALKIGGRLAVITFHSLEDRIVKHYFKSQENKSLSIISKKPIVCGEQEYTENPRARSAKLRVIQKI